MIDPAHSGEGLAFLQKNPDIQAVDLLIADLNGIFRGKRIYPGGLTHAFEDGILLAKSLFASDITGATSEYSNIGLDTGDKDCVCVPLPNTLCRVPWKDRPTAQLQMIMQDPRGTPFAGDPQTIIDDLVRRFGEMGLTPVIAIEMEFYLMDREMGPSGAPQQAVSPVTGKRQRKTQVYSITDLDDFTDFIDGVMDATVVQNIPADVAVAEYAPGQYEINLKHQANPHLACRHGMMLKRLIKGVAQQHGYLATFMPKPFADLAGSGTHVHVSLVDEAGKNIFTPGGVDNKRLRHAIGGLVAVMRESMLIFGPSANSYRRFVKGMYAPLNLNWGFNNRTVAIRVPSGDPINTRVEHRVAGADAHPYLLTASILAGMYHGLRNEIEPPAITRGDAYRDKAETDLPNSWREAIKAFNAAAILPSYLGRDFHQIYAATKQQEFELFAGEITALEYDWYLRNS